MVLQLDKFMSFKNQTQKAHFHSEFHRNISLDSVMIMKKLFVASSTN